MGKASRHTTTCRSLSESHTILTRNYIAILHHYWFKNLNSLPNSTVGAPTLEGLHQFKKVAQLHFLKDNMDWLAFPMMLTTCQ